jgi:peptidoglycan/LPS O-acetylase OafA/YrhL
MRMEVSRPSWRIGWLDYARLLCALLVVAYHYLDSGPRRGMLDAVDSPPVLEAVARYGYLGVDFFFIISGFVIMLTVGTRSASEFAAARLARLYPAFLVCATLTAAILAIGDRPEFPVSLGQWLANLTMVSPLFGVPSLDGVYWTLHYELAFYFLVFLALVAGLRERLEQLAVLWLAGQALAALAGWDVPLLSGHFVQFTSGALLYFCFTRGAAPGRLVAVLAAMALSIGWAMRNTHLLAGGNPSLDPVIAGLAVASFYALFVLFNFARIPVPPAPRAGSIVYPLYLLHQNIGFIVIPALASLVGTGPALACVAVSLIALSAAISHYVEAVPRLAWDGVARAALRPWAWLENKLRTRLVFPDHTLR